MLSVSLVIVETDTCPVVVTLPPEVQALLTGTPLDEENTIGALDVSVRDRFKGLVLEPGLGGFISLMTRVPAVPPRSLGAHQRYVMVVMGG